MTDRFKELHDTLKDGNREFVKLRCASQLDTILDALRIASEGEHWTQADSDRANDQQRREFVTARLIESLEAELAALRANAESWHADFARQAEAIGELHVKLATLRAVLAKIMASTDDYLVEEAIANADASDNPIVKAAIDYVKQFNELAALREKVERGDRMAEALQDIDECSHRDTCRVYSRNNDGIPNGNCTCFKRFIVKPLAEWRKEQG